MKLLWRLSDRNISPNSNSIRHSINYCLMTGFNTRRGMLCKGQGFEEGHFWSMTFLFVSILWGHDGSCAFPSSTSGAFSYLSLLNASFPQTLLSSAWHDPPRLCFPACVEKWLITLIKHLILWPNVHSRQGGPKKVSWCFMKCDKMIVLEGIQQRMLMSACDAVSR